MTEIETNNLIENFKEANKSLRKRSVTIGILTLLTIGLVYMESFRLSTVIDLLNYENKLDNLYTLQDSVFRKVIDGNDEKYKFITIESNCNSCLDYLTLFKKVKENNYDRKQIIEEISEIDKRIDKVNEEKAINIMGLNIPIKLMSFFFFFIMLVLFHDFTQTIIYKSKTYNRIKGIGIPNWKLGFELFGLYNTSNNPSLKFVKFTSSIISTLFIFCPFITCVLMLNLPKVSSDYEGLFILLNIFCFLLITVDTFVILYSENLWGFRYISNVFLGKSKNINRKQMISGWVAMTGGLDVFYLLILLDLNATFDFKSDLFVISTINLISMYLIVIKCFDMPNRFWRGTRATILITNSCWFVYIMSGFNNIERKYTTKNLEYVLVVYSVFLIVSIIISYIYSRWFLVDRFRLKKE